MDITFNGLNINDAVNYFVEDLPHETTAKQEVNLQRIARTNESVLLKKIYGTKVIKVPVIITDTTREALDSRLDTFKSYIEATDKNLDIDYNSTTRRYVCTGFIEDTERKPRWARVNVRFECYKAFGEDTSATSESFTGKTTSPYTDDIAILGSAPAQPDITITINTLTGSGLKFVQIKNTDTGDYVKVSKDPFEADDVIVISTSNATVTINGVSTQYLGIMPIWANGTNNWEYTDDLTARNVDIEFSYKKRYL